MELPLWAVFGLLSATLSAGVYLTQERVKLDGFVMAFWNKAACATFMLPLVLIMGAPDNPWFYVLLCSQAMIWAVNDVIFFNAIPKVGAGMLSRILPVSVIASFFVWFLINPPLWQEYMSTPLRSLGIVAALCASVYFATRLRHCPVSWQAVRIVWFIIIASVVAPITAKLVMDQASFSQGPFAYVFFEALAMMMMWMIYYAIRRPVPVREMFCLKAAKGGFMVGAFSALMVAANVTAIDLVDNPGLVPAIKFTDAFIILLYYKYIGHRETSDVKAGIGIVACAAAIIVLKSLN